MRSVSQRGFFLIEAMVAVLIFALGVLGMVALGGTAIGAQSDARYRSDAAALADEIAGQIALNVDRSNVTISPTSIQTSIAAFQMRESPADPANASFCVFSGAAGNAITQTWNAKVQATGYGLSGLPNTTATSQQIRVENDNASFNRVTITICWKSKTNEPWRHYTLVTYVN